MALVGKLFKALKSTRETISDAFDSVRKQKVSIESLDELEEILILADIGFKNVENILDVVKKNKEDNFITSVENYLISILPKNQNDKDSNSTPNVIFMVGVNGTGKTTSSAKLAKYYKSQGKKVLMIAADTYRAAAIDQLKIWSSRLDVEIIYNESSNQPSAVLFDGLSAAKSQGSNIVIVDTAGRLHTSKNLMSELEKMYRLSQKNFSSFNINSLITLDASLGQNSLIQANDFASKVQLDGAILTKMDGDARGGAAVSISSVINKPIKFIGISENIDGLTIFDPKRMADRILGLGDVVGLVQKAEKIVNESEAKIISEAGAPHSITVSTNMAGRGTDIILGGNPENYNQVSDWEKNNKTVLDTGGLYVLGTERHESRRIDNQLRGRSGRQGDPGITQFFISTEDVLVRRFGGDRIKSAMSMFKWDENEAVENKMISRSIESAQSKVEAYHFEIRKTLVDYDDVMNTQRDVIYKLRTKALFSEKLSDEIFDYINSEMSNYFLSNDLNSEFEEVNKLAFLRNYFPEESIHDLTDPNLFNQENLLEKAKNIYDFRKESLSEDLSNRLDSQIFIHAIDSKWVEHLTIMDNMRQSIGLEAIGQRNPLIQYKKMGFDMFSLLMQQIQSQIASDAIRVSNIQKTSNRIFKEQKNNFDDTRKNMEIASNNSNSTNSNLSRKDRRRMEKLNRKNSRKRK